MRNLSTVTAAIAALLDLSAGGQPVPRGPSEASLTKRLRAQGRSYAQWAHLMIVSGRDTIAAHNRQVKRRNQRFARVKGIS